MLQTFSLVGFAMAAIAIIALYANHSLRQADRRRRPFLLAVGETMILVVIAFAAAVLRVGNARWAVPEWITFGGQCIVAAAGLLACVALPLVAFSIANQEIEARAKADGA